MFSLAESARSAMRIRSVAIILPALVLFLPSNCIRLLARSEINSTRGKNSRNTVCHEGK